MAGTAAAGAATAATLSAGQIALLSLTAASTGLGVMSSVQAGQQEKARAVYSGQLADVNRTNASQAARDAIERGQQDLIAQGRRIGAVRGAQTAALAASGVDVSFGSAADVAGDTTALGRQDLATVANNAQREADSYRISAANYRDQAAGSYASAGAAGGNTLISAGSTLLEGAQRFGGQYLKYGKKT